MQLTRTAQSDVVVPQPIPGLVRENVLVEEYFPCLPMIEVVLTRLRLIPPPL
jgi:hypothetical protein